MHTRRKILGNALLLAAMSAPSLSRRAFGQDAWPSREIHTIAGTAAGTGADIYTRLYARKLAEMAGKPVIVENKPGAFGYIAAQHVEKSKPDGYTIFIGAGSFLAAAPALFKKAPFDPINDFSHVTTLFKLPFILVVSGASPYKTVEDLTEHLKQQGDKASYSSTAVSGLVASELYKAQFGLRTTEVKYKDAASALNDLWANYISFMHIDPAASAGHIKSGKLRALATSARLRFDALPDIPSAMEAGIANTNVVAWWSVHSPKNTPKPILDKLETWFNEIAVSEDTKAFLRNLGSDPFVGNATALKELLASEVKAWEQYVKIAKIEPLS
jgi:tripartite-type tricarboxylate transporter receptor subunit TctC